MRETWDRLATSAKVLPLVALLGFWVTVHFSSSTTVNGEVATCSYLDAAALLWGVVCVIGGLRLVRLGARPGNDRERRTRGWHAGIGAVVAVVGVVHALRGFGVIGGPCG